MNAVIEQITRRMSVEAIEEELAEIAEIARLEGVKNDNRDFSLEAKRAENDPLQGPAVADEIRAQGTIYRAEKTRRDARWEALAGALKHLQANDVSKQIDEMKSQHDKAVNAATAALAAVDFAKLDAFEQQIDAFLDAAAQVRAHAVVAAQTAANAGATAPGLTSLKAPAIEQLHDRLNRLAVKVAAPDLQSRGDLSRWGVKRSKI